MAVAKREQPGAGGSQPKKPVNEALARAVKDLEARVTAGDVDPCANAVLTALRDSEVQSAFVKHISDNESFRNAYCLGSYIPEEERVVFEFVCVAPKICLFPVRFLVRLNSLSGTVEDVVDPAPSLIPVSEQSPELMYRL